MFLLETPFALASRPSLLNRVGNKVGALQKAKDYAFLLLKYRPRSEEELVKRLKKKKFDEQVIENTLIFLKEHSFIDDNYFARSWIESRLKKPLGLRRLRQELKLKGISQEIIDRNIEEVKKDYSEEQLVSKIAKQRLAKLKSIEPEKAKQRLYAYLLRRGFSPEIVMDVLRQL